MQPHICVSGAVLSGGNPQIWLPPFWKQTPGSVGGGGVVTGGEVAGGVVAGRVVAGGGVGGCVLVAGGGVAGALVVAGGALVCGGVVDGGGVLLETVALRFLGRKVCSTMNGDATGALTAGRTAHAGMIHVNCQYGIQHHP